MLIGTPMVIALFDSGAELRTLSRRKTIEGIAVIALGLGGTAALFAQALYPILFLAGPLVVLTAFRLGTGGTALLVAGICAIATGATAAGIGPAANLVIGRTAQLLILQVFFLTNFALGLPVNALLAGLTRARAELRRRRDLSHSMLQNMREVIFRTDAAGRWVFLNPA